MQFNHTPATLSAAFDDANLVSSAGLVPVMRLAERAGLTHLADTHLTVPTDKGANAGAKVSSLVAGMVAGADSIEDMRPVSYTHLDVYKRQSASSASSTPIAMAPLPVLPPAAVR